MSDCLETYLRNSSGLKAFRKPEARRPPHGVHTLAAVRATQLQTPNMFECFLQLRHVDDHLSLCISYHQSLLSATGLRVGSLLKASCQVPARVKGAALLRKRLAQRPGIAKTTRPFCMTVSAAMPTVLASAASEQVAEAITLITPGSRPAVQLHKDSTTNTSAAPIPFPKRLERLVDLAASYPSQGWSGIGGSLQKRSCLPPRLCLGAALLDLRKTLFILTSYEYKATPTIEKDGIRLSRVVGCCTALPTYLSLTYSPTYPPSHRPTYQPGPASFLLTPSFLLD